LKKAIKDKGKVDLMSAVLYYRSILMRGGEQMNHNEEHEHNHEEMEEVIISFTDENDVEHQYALIEELSVGEALYGVLLLLKKKATCWYFV